MKPVRIVIPILVLGAVAAGAWWFMRPGDFLYGATVEATEVDVTARLASPVADVHVEEGEDVLAGAKLATLAGEEARLAAELAAKEFARAERLSATGSLPQAEFDRIRFQRDQAVLRASWRELTAPRDATVLRIYREPGELVSPGMPVMTLGDLAEVWGVIYVDYPKLAQLRLGQIVEGVLPEMPDRAFPGRIAVIRDEAEFTPKNVQTRDQRMRLVYGVKILFPNPDRVLKPGMTIEVRLPEE